MASAEEAALEQATARIGSLEHLLVHSKLPTPLKLAFLRHLRSELRSLLYSPSRVLTSNLPHLDALLHVLLLPSVAAPSRLRASHADLVCAFRSRPAWILVSARNPNHVCWLPSARETGIRSRIAGVVDAALEESGPTRPEVIVLFFSRGIVVGDGSIAEGLVGEFGAVELEGEEVGFGEVEEDWVCVSFKELRAFEIEVDKGRCARGFSLEGSMVADECRQGFGEGFCALVAGLREGGGGGGGEGVVNFDTTALVAIVSGISNGHHRRLVEEPEQTRERFKGNYKFVLDQVQSEAQNPIFADLKPAIAGRKGIVSTTAYEEFVDLLSMYAGPNEKRRATYLLNCLTNVSDCPSPRLSNLRTTRKIAMKNKIIFGTGDHWRASTLTANMGFVRAIAQTGMSLLTIEHRPRVLTGD